MTKLRVAVAMCLLLVSGAVLASATPSAADPLTTLTCTSTSVTTYDPPISITAAPTTRTITQGYGPCIGTGAGVSVTSGVHASSNLTHRSCLQLLSTGSVTWTITWNTGATSTVSTQRVSNLAGAVFTNTFTGTVTDGLFEGKSVVETMTSPSTEITLCTLGLGTVSTLNAVHTLTIV